MLVSVLGSIAVELTGIAIISLSMPNPIDALVLVKLNFYVSNA